MGDGANNGQVGWSGTALVEAGLSVTAMKMNSTERVQRKNHQSQEGMVPT